MSTARYSLTGSLHLVAWVAMAVMAAGGAWAAPAIDGTPAPFDDGGPNPYMVQKIDAAWAFAEALGLKAPPAPPISGTHPTVIILIQNSSVGVTFLNGTASVWSNRIQDMADYYSEVSMGAFTLSKATESHGTNNDGVIGPLNVSSITASTDLGIGGSSESVAVDAIQAANPYIDFSAYDNDSNGDITTDELHIVIYMAGDETSYSASSTPRVWAHNMWRTPRLSGLIPGSDSDSVDIQSYSMGGAEFNGSQVASMGQITHELGHDIGLADLYDAYQTGGAGDDPQDWHGVGDFALMGGGSWGTSSQPGDSPTHMCAFNKDWLGWASTTMLTAPGNQAISLASASGNNEVLRVDVSGSNEFFIIENRQKVGYDAGLPGTGGLLIFHCDGGILTDTNIRISNSVNIDGTDYGMALEEADGDNALFNEEGYDRGSDSDYFRVGNNTSFGAATSPNSNLKGGGASGVEITNISASGATMTFDLGTPPTADVDFSSATYSGTEGDGTVTITLDLSEAPGQAASVNFSAAPDTATAGDDYSPISGTVNIGASDTSASFDITIVDDTDIESAETVTLSLSTPVGLTITGQTSATLTLNDDDVDTDSDGLSDELEAQLGTLPNNADTDGDNIDDGDEVNGTLGYITDPTEADSDGDGYNDNVEIAAGTSPNNAEIYPGVAVSTFTVPFFK